MLFSLGWGEGGATSQGSTSDSIDYLRLGFPDTVITVFCPRGS